MRAAFDKIDPRGQSRSQYNLLTCRQISFLAQDYMPHSIPKHKTHLTRTPIQHLNVHDIFSRIGIDDKVICIRLVIMYLARLVCLVCV